MTRGAGRRVVRGGDAIGFVVSAASDRRQQDHDTQDQPCNVLEHRMPSSAIRSSRVENPGPDPHAGHWPREGPSPGPDMECEGNQRAYARRSPCSARSIPVEEARHSVSLQRAMQCSDAEAKAVGRGTPRCPRTAGGVSKTKIPQLSVAPTTSVVGLRGETG
jgi:hypothetical protein